MGTIKSGILGGFSGKVGPVIGGSWKGIDTMRQKPASVANPKTAGQVAQRGKFSETVAFAKAILVKVIKPLWDRFSVKMSGFNAFVQANIDLFDASGLITPANLLISRGSLALDPISLVTAVAGDSDVTLEFASTAGVGNAANSDLVYGVVYNVNQDFVSSVGGVEIRSDLEAAIPLTTPLVAGDVLECYLAFRKVDGTLVSNTSYSQFTVL